MSKSTESALVARQIGGGAFHDKQARLRPERRLSLHLVADARVSQPPQSRVSLRPGDRPTPQTDSLTRAVFGFPVLIARVSLRRRRHTLVLRHHLLPAQRPRSTVARWLVRRRT